MRTLIDSYLDIIPCKVLDKSLNVPEGVRVIREFVLPVWPVTALFTIPSKDIFFFPLTDTET
jgi:hypothetical protein